MGNGVGQGREVQLPLPFGLVSSLRWNLGREGPKGLEESGKSTQSFIPCPQLEVNLEEILGEGLLVSWAFTVAQISACGCFPSCKPGR